LRELYEFRIPDTVASKYLSRDVGQTIGTVYYVRKVVVEPYSPIFATIRNAEQSLRSQGSFFFSSVTVQRKYTQRELDESELLTLVIDSMFEPAGEECGTVYDDAEACPLCHAPRRQVTDLMLDLRTVPRSKRAAVSIARNEIVFAEPLARRILDEALTGIAFRPVHHCGKARKQLPVFLQPWITSAPISAVPPTRFGNNVFDDDPDNEHRCPDGPVVGLNLLSELYVARSSWEGEDFVQTQQYVGIRRGLLNPRTILATSQHARRVIESAGRKGITFEVAHLV
jgi:hypothetical protein